MARTNFTGFSVACDWLTLACRDFSAYADMAGWLRGRSNGWTGAKLMQYEGFKLPSGIFYGHAQQSNNKEHYLVQIPGSHAQTMLESPLFRTNFIRNWYATRIDIQKTLLEPDWWKPREILDWVFATYDNRAATIIQSSTGSTVYLGNRAGGRFCRIYEKNLGGRFLRLEIELKKAHASKAFSILLSEGLNRLPDLYQAHLERLAAPDYVKAYFTPDDFRDVDIRIAEEESDDERRYKWLVSMTPTLQRLANSHTHGSMVRQLFYSLSVDGGQNE